MNDDIIIFDSDEEMYFSWYMEELKQAGLVLQYKRPDTITLASNAQVLVQPPKKRSPQQRVILRDQTYTPDVQIHWSPAAAGVLYTDIVTEKDLEVGVAVPPAYAPFMAINGVSLVEVKGGFTEHDESRIYSILAKWVYASTGKYVQRVVVSNTAKSIFAATFTPAKFLLTNKSAKPRKLHFNARLLKDFLNTGGRQKTLP